MLVNFNDCVCINLNNVTRIICECKVISFYFTSGESHHVTFDTEEHAKANYKKIFEYKTTINIK